MRIGQYREFFSRYVLMFLFFSIIGWLYEVALAFLYGYGFVNRGFLYGPYLPLYGSGALLLILLLHPLMTAEKRPGNMHVAPAAVFLAIVLITTALEYAAGLFLETVFHQRFWDYSTYKWQFQGRICVSASIRFGLGGMFFLCILVPLFTKLIRKIPAGRRFVLSLAFIGIITADLVLTLYLASVYGFNPILAQPR